MLTCREFDQFMADYLEGNLGWSTQLAMRWHFLVCAHCRAYLDEYRRTIELGRSAFDDPEAEIPVSVPAELAAAVVAKLKSRDE